MPGRKSKAVPIVHPEVDESDEEEDEEEVEDADGRLAQSDLRRKRNRLGNGDGDEVPRFAVPTSEPLLGYIDDVDEDVDEEGDTLPLEDTQRGIEDASNIPWHDYGGEQAAIKHGAQPDHATSPVRELRSLDDAMKQSEGIPKYAGGQTLSQHVNQGAQRSPLSPTFQAIDAVMEQLNGGNSDFGVEHSEDQKWDVPGDSSVHRSPPGETRISSGQRDILSSETEVVQQDGAMRIDTPAVNEGAKEWLGGQDDLRSPHSPVGRLNKVTNEPVSDWNDMLSSGEELRIPARSPMVNSQLSVVLEALLKRHLDPFEKSLAEVRSTVQTLSGQQGQARRPASAYEKSDSDADDEEDDETYSQARPRSAKTDKRTATIKAAIQEALAVSQNSSAEPIEHEVKLRKAAEHRAEEVQKLLTLSEKEIDLYKEGAERAEEEDSGLRRRSQRSYVSS